MFITQLVSLINEWPVKVETSCEMNKNSALLQCFLFSYNMINLFILYDTGCIHNSYNTASLLTTPIPLSPIPFQPFRLGMDMRMNWEREALTKTIIITIQISRCFYNFKFLWNFIKTIFFILGNSQKLKN